MDDSKRPPIRVYIENAHDDAIGGFTIPLPTSKESLQPWLVAIEVDSFHESDIAIREVQSSVPGLEAVLDGFGVDNLTFDELNYLAVKIQGLESWKMELFTAAMEAELHGESISDLLDLTENIGLYDLQPAFSEEQYGEFLIEAEKDNTVEAFERLEKSELIEEQELAQHILRLEACADAVEYGRTAAREENGVFTKYGYIALRGEIKEVYRGQEDIPFAHRIFSAPPPLMMATDVDVPAFLAALHATAGDFSRDAEHTIDTLSGLRSAEYLLLMDDTGAFLTESMHAYRQGTDAHSRWIGSAENPETQAFSIHLTEVHGQIRGNIAEINAAERRQDIQENSIQPVTVEATLPSGEVQRYLPQEWDAIAQIDKDGIKDWRRVFADGDFSKVNQHLEHMNVQTEAACRKVPAPEFLIATNAVYMEHAQNPQHEMLRISQDAAKEMLARSDCDVYRLLPNGPEKLVPTDAIKSGLWFIENREFAICRGDIQGLEKWAERSAKEAITRQQERSEQKKTYEPEV